MISALCIGIAAVLLAVAASRDLIARSVPNALCGALALDGFAMQLAARHALVSAAASVLVFAVGFLLWLRGFVGGADVKLLGAVCLLVRPFAIGQLVIAIALAGGVLGILYLGARRAVPRTSSPAPRGALSRILRVERYRMTRGFPLPYAVAIASGTAIAFGRGLAG